MTKPVTVKVWCPHCERSVRLSESVTADLFYSLKLEVACPKCGRRFPVSLSRSRVASMPPAAAASVRQELVLPAPAMECDPRPHTCAFGPRNAPLPFPPLLEEKKECAVIDAPFAPIQLVDDTTQRHRRSPIARMWKRIPLAHRVTWALAIAMIAAALLWPNSRANDSTQKNVALADNAKTQQSPGQ